MKEKIKKAGGKPDVIKAEVVAAVSRSAATSSVDDIPAATNKRLQDENAALTGRLATLRRFIVMLL